MISGVDTKLSMLRANMQKDEQEISACESKLSAFCDRASLFPELLKNTEAELVLLREKIISMKSGIRFYETILVKYEENKCCSTCKRGFPGEDDGAVFKERVCRPKLMTLSRSKGESRIFPIRSNNAMGK